MPWYSYLPTADQESIEYGQTISNWSRNYSKMISGPSKVQDPSEIRREAIQIAMKSFEEDNPGVPLASMKSQILDMAGGYYDRMAKEAQSQLKAYGQAFGRGAGYHLEDVRWTEEQSKAQQRGEPWRRTEAQALRALMREADDDVSRARIYGRREFTAEEQQRLQELQDEQLYGKPSLRDPEEVGWMGRLDHFFSLFSLGPQATAAMGRMKLQQFAESHADPNVDLLSAERFMGVPVSAAMDAIMEEPASFFKQVVVPAFAHGWESTWEGRAGNLELHTSLENAKSQYRKMAVHRAIERMPGRSKQEILKAADQLYERLVDEDWAATALEHPIMTQFAFEMIVDPSNYVPGLTQLGLARKSMSMSKNALAPMVKAAAKRPGVARFVGYVNHHPKVVDIAERAAHLKQNMTYLTDAFRFMPYLDRYAKSSFDPEVATEAVTRMQMRVAEDTANMAGTLGRQATKKIYKATGTGIDKEYTAELVGFLDRAMEQIPNRVKKGEAGRKANQYRKLRRMRDRLDNISEVTPSTEEHIRKWFAALDPETIPVIRGSDELSGELAKIKNFVGQKMDYNKARVWIQDTIDQSMGQLRQKASERVAATIEKMATPPAAVGTEAAELAASVTRAGQDAASAALNATRGEFDEITKHFRMMKTEDRITVGKLAELETDPQIDDHIWEVMYGKLTDGLSDYRRAQVDEGIRKLTEFDRWKFATEKRAGVSKAWDRETGRLHEAEAIEGYMPHLKWQDKTLSASERLARDVKRTSIGREKIQSKSALARSGKEGYDPDPLAQMDHWWKTTASRVGSGFKVRNFHETMTKMGAMVDVDMVGTKSWATNEVQKMLRQLPGNLDRDSKMVKEMAEKLSRSMLEEQADSISKLTGIRYSPIQELESGKTVDVANSVMGIYRRVTGRGGERIHDTVTIGPEALKNFANEMTPFMSPAELSTQKALLMQLGRGLSTFQKIWRYNVTIPFYAFSARNFLGGFGLSTIAMGVRSLDPRLQFGALAAGMAAAAGGKGVVLPRLRNIPWKLQDGAQTTLGQILDIAEHYGITSQLGESMMIQQAGIGLGDRALQAMSRAGEFDVSGLIRGGTRQAEKMLQGPVPGAKMLEGAATGLESIKAFSPGYMSKATENYQHLVTFMGALKGLDEKSIAKALDFSSEMSANYLRRPVGDIQTFFQNGLGFYGWARFILPHTIKMAAKHPQRYAAWIKSLGGIERYYDDNAPFTGLGTPAWMAANALPGSAGAQPQLYEPGSHKSALAMIENPISMGLGFMPLFSSVAGGQVYGQKMSDFMGPLLNFALEQITMQDIRTGAPLRPFMEVEDLPSFLRNPIGKLMISPVQRTMDSWQTMTDLYASENPLHRIDLGARYRAGSLFLGLDNLAMRAIGKEGRSIGGMFDPATGGVPGMFHYLTLPEKAAWQRTAPAIKSIGQEAYAMRRMPSEFFKMEGFEKAEGE